MSGAADTVFVPAAGLLVLVLLCLTMLRDTRLQPQRGIVAWLTGGLTLLFMAWRVRSVTDPRMQASEAGISLVLLTLDLVAGLDFLVFLASIGRFRNRRPEADRHDAALARVAPAALPHVDVWIATFNEDWAILEKTVIGALNLDWPAERLHIWLLDDGRRTLIEDRCRGLGIHYVTRLDNRHRKAGNHNNALARTSSPFILSLDADFIPFPSAIRRMLGFFDEPDVAIVQTPQAFYNPEPFRNNLQLYESMPDDLELFYRIMQPGRDAWGVAFYCGTSALLRRSALDAVGGFATQGDIEDQITSMKLLQAGWRTIYLDEQLSVGLAPESTSSLHDQRNRWCRGSLQILFTSYGPFGRGWTIMQRILFSQSFWILGAVLPLYFAMLPMIIWFYGPGVLSRRPLDEVIMMPLLMVAGVWVALMWLCERTWIPVVSSAYQLFIAIAMLPTALTSIIKPFGRPLLRINRVTNKGSAVVRRGTDISSLLVLVGIIGGTIGAVVLAGIHPRSGLSEPLAIAVALGWTALGLGTCFIALLTCFELPYRRGEQRFSVDVNVEVGRGGVCTTGQCSSLSLSGASIVLDAAIPFPVGSVIALTLRGIVAELPARVVWVDGPRQSFALSFDRIDTADRRLLTEFLFVRTGGTAGPTPSRLITLLTRRFFRVSR